MPKQRFMLVLIMMKKQLLSFAIKCSTTRKQKGTKQFSGDNNNFRHKHLNIPPTSKGCKLDI
jgi:hypothetical protein